MSIMNKLSTRRSITRIAYLIVLILAVSITSTLAFAETIPSPHIQSNEYILDECFGVVHFPNWGDYPDINTSDPLFSGALSLGILGFTFDLGMVPYGSEMTVDFADGWSSTGMVGEDGKTIIYRGLWGYGNYDWVDVVVDPSGHEINTGLVGTLVVDSNEVECGESSLESSPLPAEEPTSIPTLVPTSTPGPITHPTASPTAEDEPEVFSGPDTVDTTNEDKGGFFDDFISASSWIYYCLIALCCIILLAIGFTVVIIIRRRGRRIEGVDVVIKN